MTGVGVGADRPLAQFELARWRWVLTGRVGRLSGNIGGSVGTWQHDAAGTMAMGMESTVRFVNPSVVIQSLMGSSIVNTRGLHRK